MIYRFGDFTLDPVRELLIGPEGRISMRGHSLLVLKLLIERSPEVVSKDEILESVWGHDALSESAISQVIKDLRQALGDSAKQPTQIVTRYGRGYQFIATVDLIAPDDVTEEKPKRWLSLAVTAVALIGLSWLGQLALGPDSPSSAPEMDIYLRALDEVEGDSLSRPLADYLGFVVGSTVDGARVSVSQDEHTEPGDRVFAVGLGIRDENVDNRLALTIGEIAEERELVKLSYASADQLVGVSLEEIFSAIEVNPAVAVEAGLISKSAFATETLLRGMAAQYAGELDRAIALFEACLAEDPGFDFARYELAIALRRQGDYQAALAQIDALAPSTRSEFWRFRLYNAKGIALWRLARKAEAVEAYEYAVDAAGTPLNRAMILVNVALLQRDLGNLEAAEIAALESMRAGDEADHLRLKANARNALASIYMRTGRLVDAIEPLEQAATLFQAMGNRASYASVLSRTADVRLRLGELENADQLLRLILGLREQLGDNLGAASALFRLARLQRVKGDFASATESANRGLALASAESDSNLMRNGHAALAGIHLAAGRVQDAALHADEAYRLAERRSEPANLIDADIARIRVGLRSDLAASDSRARVDELVQRAEALGDQVVLLNAKLLRADLAQELGERAGALAELTAVLSLSQEQGENEHALRALLELVELSLPDAPESAVNHLREAELLNPPPFPFLLLRAKTMAIQGQGKSALALALEAKEKSGDWWGEEEQAFLSGLRDGNQ